MRSFHRVAPLVLIAAFSFCGYGKPGTPVLQAATTDSNTLDGASNKKIVSVAAPGPLPASKPVIDLTGIGPDYYAALVVKPHRITQYPLVAQQLKVDAIAKQIKKLGFDPTQIEQLVVLAPRPEKHESNEFVKDYPTLIAHFRHPVDPKKMLAKFRQAMQDNRPDEITETQLAGKTCYDARMPYADFVAYAPNATTVIVANRLLMWKIITAGEPKGPLVEKLKKTDADNDVIAVMTLDHFPGLDILLDQVKRGESQIVVNYIDAVKTLHGGQATMNFKSDALLHIALDAKSEDAASDIASMFDGGVQLLGAGLATVKMQIPSEQRKTYAGVLKLGNQLIAAASSKSAGSQVDFVVKRPAGIDAELPKLAETVKRAVAEAQASAQRALRMNSLHQIAFAMLSYEEAKGHFPPAAIEKDGKRLLSWRVAILPYMDQDDLYKKFHLDEPWDSPHNLALAKEIPSIYSLPNPAGDGKTAMMVFTGKDTAFDGNKGIKTADIRDGMSNTILCVEAGADKAVVWTKPDDLPFNPANPLAPLGKVSPDGINAAWFDGSVRQLKKIDKATLNALITPAGGEAVDY